MQDQLLDAYHHLDGYPEVLEPLKSLKNRGYGTGILYNGSPEMLSSGVEYSQLEDLLDSVLSVEEVGAFNPGPLFINLLWNVFRLNRERFFFSSNAWDVCEASNFGFQTLWINRLGQKQQRLPGRYLFEIQRLDEFLGQVE